MSSTSTTKKSSSPFRRLYDRLTGRSSRQVETPAPAGLRTEPAVDDTALQWPVTLVVGQRFRAVDWDRTAPAPTAEVDPLAPPDPQRLHAVGQRFRAVNWTRQRQGPSSLEAPQPQVSASSQNKTVDDFFSQVNW